MGRLPTDFVLLTQSGGLELATFVVGVRGTLKRVFSDKTLVDNHPHVLHRRSVALNVGAQLVERLAGVVRRNRRLGLTGGDQERELGVLILAPVQRDGLAHTVEVGSARGLIGQFNSPLHSRHQQRGQNRDNRDYNQQLNQRKTFCPSHDTVS